MRIANERQKDKNVRSAYQPPASSIFLSERTSHQQPAANSQQYSSLRTNQHQPPANRTGLENFFYGVVIIIKIKRRKEIVGVWK
jgi:hypothetical protein